jgi:hypothetical protein
MGKESRALTGEKDTGISIWFFIGTLLLIYGAMIAGADLYYHNHPGVHDVVMKELRAGLWWGLCLFFLGVFYCWKFRPKRS